MTAKDAAIAKEPVPNGNADFSIASWNVHMGVHNDRHRAKTVTDDPADRNDVVAGCVALDVDVLILQEAWWWGMQESDLIDQVTEAVGGVAHHYTSPSALRRYPALWTTVIITRVGATRLDDIVVPAVGRRQRAVPVVRLDNGASVVGGHFDGIHSLRVRPDVWLRQSGLFASIAEEHDVFAGDMNMWGPVMERNVAPMRRAVHGRTWPAWRPHSQIDHILVGERVAVVSGEVLPDMGSDHRAIRAELRLRGGV